MSSMSYNTGQLRDGAGYDRKGSDAADAASRGLGGVNVAASIFGDVDGGGPLSGALGSARDDHMNAARTAASSMDGQAARTDRTAALGDDLTIATTTIANRGLVNRVVHGMK